ncbi:hypothetical protein BH09VER1_BH09VER1_39620 [soil metagenome]
MRHLFTLFLGFFALTGSQAKENEIFLHNGGIVLAVPSDWVILAHSPTGKRTVIAFQIFGNPAEIGGANSTNLSISTFALNDPEAAQAFAAPLTKRAQETTTTREYENWSIREWQGDQNGTKYQIIDGRATNKALNVGIHVRLAWPLLPNNPDVYEDTMKTLFKTMLDSITQKNPEVP